MARCAKSRQTPVRSVMAAVGGARGIGVLVVEGDALVDVVADRLDARPARSACCRTATRRSRRAGRSRSSGCRAGRRARRRAAPRPASARASGATTSGRPVSPIRKSLEMRQPPRRRDDARADVAEAVLVVASTGIGGSKRIWCGVERSGEARRMDAEHQQHRRRLRAFVGDVVAGADLHASSLKPTEQAVAWFRSPGLFLATDLHRHLHAEIVVAVAGERAGERQGLARLAGDGDADQLVIAEDGVGRVDIDPAGAGQIDLHPGMGGAAAMHVAAIARGHVEVAGDETRRQAERAQRLDHQHGEVAAGAGAARQRLERKLDTLLMPAHIGQAAADAHGSSR